MRKLSRSRVTVALIYNIKEEALQEQPDPQASPPSANPSPAITPEDNPELSPTGDTRRVRHNDFYAEWDSPETIHAIRDALQECHEVSMIEANEDAYGKLLENRPEIAFNMSEGLHGVSREAQIPAILEMLRIPYLGSDPLTLALCLDKARAKEVLTYHKIRTPRFAIVKAQEEIEDTVVRFPVMVKPLHEGSSKGIYNSSVARNPGDLKREVHAVLERYNQPALIEEFLPGREFTIAILGNGDEARCLPLVEINYDAFPAGSNPVYGYEAKWVWDTPDNPLDVFTCPAGIEPELKASIEGICLKAYHVLGCRDWSRIDVRLDKDGEPAIIEVNPLPGVLPKVEDNSCFPKAARAIGMSYNELILTVLDIAIDRNGLTRPVPESRNAVAV